MDCWLNTLSYSTVCLAPVMSQVSVVAFLRPCISLKWHFGAIRWSWLGSLVLVLGGLDKPCEVDQCLLSSIWNVLEYKKGAVGPQTRPLDFLCIPFCTPIFRLEYIMLLNLSIILSSNSFYFTYYSHLYSHLFSP